MRELSKITTVLFFLIVIRCGLFCQVGYQNTGFQSLVSLNPSAAGAEANGQLRIVYHNFYPGHGFDMHSVLVSFDEFIPSLHGGLAFYLSENYLGGIINDTRAGFSYSYHFQAGRDLYIYAGLSAAFQHRGINTSRIVMPDQIDPLRGAVLPSGETISGRGRTIFDAGTGFIASYRNFTAGLAVNHLAKPDPSGSGFPEDVLPRQITFFAYGLLSAGERNKLFLRPALFFDTASGGFIAGAGATAGIESLSVNTLLTGTDDGQLNLNAGISFKIWKGMFFYGYCFNLKSDRVISPFSIYQRGGLVISLNNVEKRKTINTIIFPEM